MPWVSMADALGWAVERPARTLTGHRSPRWAYGQGAASYSTGWTLETEQRSETRDGRVPICREHDQPAPVVVANSYKWELHGDSRGNATIRGLDEPAATVFSSRSGNLRWAYRNGSRTNAAVRDLDEPAPTVHFGARGNQVDWVAERPATTVCADPRLAGPGHRDREGGQRQYDTATRRVTIREAAVLQSVRPDYPWRGNKTQQYQQAANMVPPLLGAAVVGELLGVDWRARLWGHDTEEVAG